MENDNKLPQGSLKPINLRAETPKKSATDSKTICAVPWMHLNFEPNGKVLPCCLTSSQNYFAGDLKTQSIKEIWNSTNMKNLRKEMINGRRPSICSTCFNKEDVTGTSGRTYHNRDFPDVIEKIPSITLGDGTCTEMNLKYWDFRFSNLCNFKCRSCGPRYSSSWVPDAKKMGISNQEKIWNITAIEGNTNMDFVDEQISNVKRIYFAGGEPLLMDEHWYILEKLVEHERFDVKLSYNTNCSTLYYGKKNVIDYWKKWQLGKLEVWPSIDEIGERAELLRSGTIWSKVEDNLKELTKYNNIILRPGMTIGAWNVNRLPEIITHLVDIGVIKRHDRAGQYLNYDNFFFNLLSYPKHYHVSILPDNYRQATIKRLREFITDFNKKHNTSIDYIFTQIFHELKQPFSLDSARRFISTTEKLDEIRSENLFSIIPEMECVRAAVNGN
jgi:radical SAM protein with 4Fe4S-binding SPASM domain